MPALGAIDNSASYQYLTTINNVDKLMLYMLYYNIMIHQTEL